MILKCSVDQISNKKVKAIYTEQRRNITYSPGLDSVLAVVKIHIFDLLLVGSFSLVSLEDSHSFFNLALERVGVPQHLLLLLGRSGGQHGGGERLLALDEDGLLGL